MAGVFICYRRGPGSSPTAGRLNDGFVARFGRTRVFMDVDTIEPGQDFEATITQAISSSDVFVAVIDPLWLESTGSEDRPRINDPSDYVRREVEEALRHGVRVVPVLIQGARMPHAEELPPTLKPLANRQAVTLTDERWSSDINRLLSSLEDDVPVVESRTRNRTSPGQPQSRIPQRIYVGILTTAWLAGLIWVASYYGVATTSTLWVFLGGGLVYLLLVARIIRRVGPL